VIYYEWLKLGLLRQLDNIGFLKVQHCSRSPYDPDRVLA
jgi:hypothetical protein